MRLLAHTKPPMNTNVAARQRRSGRSLITTIGIPIGILLACLGILGASASSFLFTVVPFQRLRTISVHVDRVQVVTPMRSGRYVVIWTREQPVASFAVREAANFLDAGGVQRFLNLQSGDRVVAWLAPGGWSGENNVWQLWRGTEQVVGYSEMLEATKRGRRWARSSGAATSIIGILLLSLGFCHRRVSEPTNGSTSS